MTKPKPQAVSFLVLKQTIVKAAKRSRKEASTTKYPHMALAYVLSLWADLLRTAVIQSHYHPEGYVRTLLPKSRFKLAPLWDPIIDNPKSKEAYWTALDILGGCARSCLGDRNAWRGTSLDHFNGLLLLSSTLAYHRGPPNYKYPHVHAVDRALQKEARFLIPAFRLLLSAYELEPLSLALDGITIENGHRRAYLANGSQ